MKKIILFLTVLNTLSLTYSPAQAKTVEYDLDIAWQEITIHGKTAKGMTINGEIPGPTLYFTEGDLARIRVHNSMDVPTSIHWHGILVPPGMDGVPMVTQPPIAPDTTFTYEFPIRQSGTYWYHSHSGLQEQRGLYGSIVIAPRQEKIKPDHDRVVLLSDWTTDSPDYVLKTLKRGSEWYALEKGSAQSIFGALKAGRLGDYFKRELQRMPPMDIADVAYDYFLANGKPEVNIKAKAGEKLRLRIINGSATTYFHLEFSGGPMTIVSADGIDVQHVDKKRFLIGVAETYDVLISVPGPGTYELKATAHDGSAHSSTWIGSGLKHPAPDIPKPDVYRSMHHGSIASLFALTPAGTMGMSDHMVEMGMFDKPGMAGMDHGEGHDMGDTSSHDMKMDEPHQEMSDTPMSDMLNEHNGMKGEAMDMSGMTDQKTDMGDAATPMEHQMGDESKEMGGQEMAMPSGKMMEDSGPKNGRSYGTRFGLLAADAASRGHLATDGGEVRPWAPYKDLRSPAPTAFPADKKIREIRLALDGDMGRYVWLLNNKPLSETDHILIREGEVVRFIMINRTMMHHPMHLHGHFFRVLNGQGDHAPLKHTVNVAPMTTTVFEFYTDEPGDWFFHCHLLYHMKSGMSRLVHYQDFTPDDEVLGVRPRLYKDSWYFAANAEALSNMTEGMLSFSNTRLMFDLSWEAGWEEEADEEEWEGIARLGWYLNRFSKVFIGGRSEGVRSEEHESVGILGLTYLLPLNIETTAWIDDEEESRVIFEKEFELTPRLAIHGEAEYDSSEHWEGAVGMQYMINRHVSLAGKWHSEFGWGGGLNISF
ncbi:MAG: multicopper oxidase domain-containing protein [Thermodesulfobacteriota bacterium]